MFYDLVFLLYLSIADYIHNKKKVNIETDLNFLG